VQFRFLTLRMTRSASSLGRTPGRAPRDARLEPVILASLLELTVGSRAENNNDLYSSRMWELRMVWARRRHNWWCSGSRGTMSKRSRVLRVTSGERCARPPKRKSMQHGSNTVLGGRQRVYWNHVTFKIGWYHHPSIDNITRRPKRVQDSSENPIMRSDTR
jgi:hypothetical protein